MSIAAVEQVSSVTAATWGVCAIAPMGTMTNATTKSNLTNVLIPDLPAAILLRLSSEEKTLMLTRPP
jgi:hypothetical protein